MDPIIFTEGVTQDRVYAHRGDVFLCEGLFKSERKVDKDDHILCKPNRPVVIVSDDNYNKTIVKVLPLSTSSGSKDPDACTSGRCIQIPSISNDRGVTYIDVSQEFTINVHQLKYKLASLSQEIVDTAVAYNLLQKIPNATCVDTIVNVLQNRYPKSTCFENINVAGVIDNKMAPFVDVYAPVKEVKNVTTNRKSVYPPHSTYEEADAVYQEWLSLGTDMFCYRYQLTRERYTYLRKKCISLLQGVKNGFTKFDWQG